MPDSISFVLLIVAVALVFDFINGFHDSANSIATVVSTRVLSPGVAVAWAAFFNFIAAFTVGTAVAKTISKGLVDPAIVDPTVVLAALLGAIVWNLVTWYVGLPSSSSHALLGRIRRRGHRQGRHRRAHPVRMGEADPRHRHLTAARRDARPRAHGRLLLAAVQEDRPAARQALPPAAARVGGPLFAEPRRQRRAEDHGHHRRACWCRRSTCSRTRPAGSVTSTSPTPIMCRSGSSCRPTAPSPWARRWAAGAS